jgi:DNA-directed RNA polymerase subunit M
MEITFCSCGGIFAPFGSYAVKCRSCGKTEEMMMESKMTTHTKKEEVIVIENNKPDRLPETDKTCPKCQNKRAYWWIIQTRSSDEPPTRFFRCTKDKCKHTWREYS